jgi:hypothetical protein
MLDELVELLEGALVEEEGDPLARGELALDVLPLDAVRSPAGVGLSLLLPENLQRVFLSRGALRRAPLTPRALRGSKSRFARSR